MYRQGRSPVIRSVAVCERRKRGFQYKLAPLVIERLLLPVMVGAAGPALCRFTKCGLLCGQRVVTPLYLI